MSLDAVTTKKFREASILASKFFKDLANIFDGQDQGHRDQSLSIKARVPESTNDSTTAKTSHKYKLDASQPDSARKSSSPSGKIKDVPKKREKKVKETKKEGSGVKRPLSAYMLYNNFRRPQLRQEKSSLTLPEISKIIGEEWKRISVQQKQSWIAKAEDLMVQYKLDVLDHQKNQQNQGKVSKKPSEKKEIKNGDKRTFQEMSKASLKKEKKKADSSFSDTSDDENPKKNQSGVKKANDSDESDL